MTKKTVNFLSRDGVLVASVPFELRENESGKEVLYAYGDATRDQKDFYIFGLLRTGGKMRRGESDEPVELTLPGCGQSCLAAVSYFTSGMSGYRPKTIEMLLDYFRCLSFLGYDLTLFASEMFDWIDGSREDNRGFTHEMFELIGWKPSIKYLSYSEWKTEFSKDEIKNGYWPFWK